MPNIRGVLLSSTGVTIDTARGKKTFVASQIPSNATVAQAESLANAWLATNVPEAQFSVHVFSLSPMRMTVGAWDWNTTIPAQWWE